MTDLTFADRVRAVVAMAGEKPTPWAAALGIGAATIHDWLEGGKKPYAKTMAKLVAGTGIPEDWWLNGDLPPPTPAPQADRPYANTPLIRNLSAQDSGSTAPPPTVLSDDEYDGWAETVSLDRFAPVRYYSQVAMSAGHGALNEDHEPDALLFSRKFLRRIGVHPKHLLMVRVRGDSMFPTLLDGWTVMIDVSRTRVDSGIYAIQSGGMEMVKRLESRLGGVVRVMSDNPRYEEYEVNMADDGFAVIGKVIWIGGLAQ